MLSPATAADLYRLTGFVYQSRGCGRRERAPRRTREKDHLDALDKLAGGGSLQPPYSRFPGTPSPRNRGRAMLSAGSVRQDSTLQLVAWTPWSLPRLQL